jgi:hypothetical protein
MLSPPALWAIVNNAGINAYGDTELCTMDMYRRQTEVNLFGTMRATKACIKMIRRTKGEDELHHSFLTVRHTCTIFDRRFSDTSNSDQKTHILLQSDISFPCLVNVTIIKHYTFGRFDINIDKLLLVFDFECCEDGDDLLQVSLIENSPISSSISYSQVQIWGLIQPLNWGLHCD